MSDTAALVEELDLSGLTDSEKIRKIRLLNTIRTTLGPQLLEVLEDVRTQEINVNPDSTVWVRRLGEAKSLLPLILKPSNVASVIRIVASMAGTTVDERTPILDCEFPLDGSRFAGMLPPIVARPIFSIRKRAVMLMSLNDYVKSGVMTFDQAEAIRAAVRAHRNILVAGGTASGKTTLLNAVMMAIEEETPDDRIVIIEDTQELQCAIKEKVFMRTSDYTTMLQLLKGTMRHSPDRICVGEVRDGAAFTLLKAWNTGHSGGIATLHSDGRPEDALARLNILIQEASSISQKALIGDAVHVVVNIEKYGFGRRVTGVSAINGYDQANDKFNITPLC
jgi:type IV secretion system protein VirB11